MADITVKKGPKLTDGNVVGFDYKTGLPLAEGQTTQQDSSLVNFPELLPLPTAGDVMGTATGSVTTAKPFALPTNPGSTYDAALAAADVDAAKAAGTQVDENAIRSNVLGQFQAQIDAANTIYNQKLQQAKVSGANRLGSASAIQGRRGTLGTDFAGAQNADISTGNQSIEDSINAERQAAIAEIMNKATGESSAQIAAKTAAKAAGVDAHLKYLSEAGTRKVTNAETAATALVNQGLKIEDLASGDISKLAANYGVTKEDIINAYAPAKQKKELADATALKTLNAGQPASVQEYEYAKKGGYTGSYNDYQTLDANRKAITANAAGLTPAQQNAAFKLSDDYEARSKDFYAIRDNYNKVVASSSNPSPAGDLSLIFAYMKTLDPGSVVREGEFATAQNAGSIPDRITATYNKIINGERLSDAQRSDFVASAKRLYSAANTQQQQTNNDFIARAGQYGVPANLIVRDTNATSDQTTKQSSSSTGGGNTFGWNG